MHVYFAGATRVEEGFPELQHEVRKRLVSYHYQTESLDKYYYIDERDKYEYIILDSGAFSAWSQKAIIDIDAYIQYALKWESKVDYIVNLDVIPAEPGTKFISIEEIERSASKGYENYYKMLNAGIPKDKLIHVFHQNEDLKWLKKMVHEDKMPYIGLSPANDRTVIEKMQWLDECMPIVTDKEGFPIVKFHGFAVTSYNVMKRYPWFSVDSSTWAVAGGRGEVFTPMNDEDGMDFTVAPRKLAMSQIGGKVDHYYNLHPESSRRRYLEEYLKVVGVPKGSQLFLRVHKDYVIDKEAGYRKCSNSFIKNMQFEELHSGMLPEEAINEININKKDIVIMYDGPDYKWVERVVEKGILNYWKERQRLNAIFMNTFVGILDKQEPRKFDYSNRAEGFGFGSNIEKDEDLLI